MNLRRTIAWGVPLLALALGSLGPGAAARAGMVTYDVIVDTSGLAGTAGSLDFQFNPADMTSPAATATIPAIITDGASFGPPATFGDVSGSFPGPLTFDNGTPTNEFTQGFTYGTFINFDVTLSGPAVGGSGPFGSTFVLALYDALGNPLSNSPTNATATIDINPDGTTTPTTYPPITAGSPVATVTPAAVPEPSGVALLGLGLATVAGWARRRSRAA